MGELIIRNGGLVIQDGGMSVTGSIDVKGDMNISSGSVTGSSYNSITSSFALTASFLQGSITSASFASTASFLQGSIASSSFAATASFAPYRFELGVKSGDGVTAITTGSKGIKSIDFTGNMIEWILSSDVNTTSSVSVWRATRQIPTTAGSIFTASLAGQFINSGSLDIDVSTGDMFRLEVKTNNTSSYLFLEMKITS